MEQQAPQRGRKHLSEKYGLKFVNGIEKLYSRALRLKSATTSSSPDAKPAPSGYDSTPIPQAPPGYTLKFTIHRAVNLPAADLGSLSSDPFVVVQLIVKLPRRNKQDPDMVFRTPTIRKNINPVWESEWIVANVPASGFELKCRLYDEDPVNHDDRLGNAQIQVDSVCETWTGINEQAYRIKKRMGSKKVYLFRHIRAAFCKSVEINGHLFISAKCLGKTPGNEGGRVYTIGPNYWIQHFSPLIGWMTGTKYPTQDGKGKRLTRHNFRAIQIQLRGPVPARLYHRYVGVRPTVMRTFTSHSLRGYILKCALHHQHTRIYNFDQSTVYGVFPSPSSDLTEKFLEFVHYGQEGRLFTYVITLDGQWRFTETGKEFGIDALSKHTMHSDVSFYVAYSGEFFVRRLKHPRGTFCRSSHFESIEFLHDPQSREDEISRAPNDPSVYELVIDNDSGTYRPNPDFLPELKEFLSGNLPGLQVTTLDCQKDSEYLKQLKSEQRACKHRERRQVTYFQDVDVSKPKFQRVGPRVWRASGKD